MKIRLDILIISVICMLFIFVMAMHLCNKFIKKDKTDISDKSTFNFNDNNNDDEILQEKKIQVGTYYTCSNAGSIGYIIFNDANTFEMKIGDIGTEYWIVRGTYEVIDNIINMHINYDSAYLLLPSEELDPSFEEYNINVNILRDNMLEYVNEVDISYIFKITNEIDENLYEEETSFFKEIYEKYPDLKNKEGYICTDGEQYWLLDNAGNKVYFSDMESFERALVKTYTSESISNSIDTDDNTIINSKEENTSNSNSQVSEARLIYNQIVEGMSYYQVISILGKPKSSSSTSIAKNCVWVISGKVIIIQFMNDRVYQKTFNENSSTSSQLDPETKRLISFSVGFALEEYTTQLDQWGIKYEIIKEQNLNYDNNVVTKIEPNNCNIDKNTTVKLTVSDNTYTMDVVVDTMYLLMLAEITNKEYSSEYNDEAGRYVGDKIDLVLKINGNTIFNGKAEALNINNAISIGKIKGKPTDKYNIEVTIEGVKIQKNINYYIRCNTDSSRFEIYAGGNIGAG